MVIDRWEFPITPVYRKLRGVDNKWLSTGGGGIIHNGQDKSMFVLSNVAVGRKPALPATAYGVISCHR